MAHIGIGTLQSTTFSPYGTNHTTCGNVSILCTYGPHGIGTVVSQHLVPTEQII